MTLPTVTKTWDYTKAQLLTSAQAAYANSFSQMLVDMVSALIGLPNVPCTVRYSCNGTTAGTVGDGVNRWTQASLVSNWISTNKCWMVIKFPNLGGAGGNAQLLIYNFQSTTLSGSIVFSPSAGFTGGSTSAVPSATDQITLVSGTLLEQNNTTNRAYRVSTVQSTDGLNTRVFCCSAGALAFNFFANTAESLDSGVSNGMAVSWWSAAAYPAPSAASFGAKPASSNATAFLGYNQPLCSINQASDYSGLWPVSPCSLVANSASNHGQIGILPDFWVTSTSVVTGDTAPLTGTANQFVAVGPGILVPWNGGAFSLS